MPWATACFGRPKTHGLAIEQDLAGLDAIGAENGARGLAAPCADQAGEPQDLPLVQDEVDVLQVRFAFAGEVPDFEQGRADACRGLPRHIGEFASDHHIDDLADARFGPVNGVHIAAITEGRDAVGDAQDLLDAMRDINDGNPLLLETSNQVKKPLSLAIGQRGIGLVHDDQPRVGRQRLGDLHQLPLGNGEVADGGARGDIQPHLGGHFARCRFHGAPVDPARP